MHREISLIQGLSRHYKMQRIKARHLPSSQRPGIAPHKYAALQTMHTSQKQKPLRLSEGAHI